MPELPVCLDAERAILGAVVFDTEKMKIVRKYISADDFYNVKHAELFRALEICIADGGVGDNGSVDLTLLQDVIQKRGGDADDFKNLIDAMFAQVDFLGNTERYAKQIRDRSDRRKIIKLCAEVVQDCKEIDSSLNNTIDKLLSGATEGRSKAENISNFNTALYNYFEYLRGRQLAGERMPGIATGFPTVDAALGGLEDGKLYIIGGRPAMGKTAFALNAAEHIAQEKKTVVLFSLEMGENEVMKRIVSSVEKINSYALKMAACTENEMGKILDILGKIESNSMYICDESYQTADSIYSKCLDINAHLQKNGKRIEAVVIDYLQLISASEKREDRRITIGKVSRTCKIMAKKLNCPVILISQLSRAVEAREDKRPRLSDLRESGEIEQDADAVMFLFREEHYAPTPHNKGKAELIIAKNRDGEVGKINLRWHPQILKFEEEARTEPLRREA